MFVPQFVEVFVFPVSIHGKPESVVAIGDQLAVARQIAQRLQMGSWRSLNNKLYLRRRQRRLARSVK